MKLAFVNKLIEVAEKDPRVMLLTGDLGFQIFDDFYARYGPRYVNVGVAEAELVNAAAGLALVGKKPVTYSIASFMTSRCFEQIKLSIAYHGLPVVICGAGGGYAYGHSGVTHHAPDDISLMCAIPGMTVIAPGDANEVTALLPQIMELKGPSYIRIGRGKEAVYESDSPCILGRARLLSEGQDIAILTTGDIAFEALTAVKALNKEGVFPMLYQFHTIKPVDTAVLDAISKSVEHIIVIEENIPIGGLSSVVRRHFMNQKNAPNIISLTAPDEFVLGSPHQHEIRSVYRLNSKAIVENVKKLS
ncbi:transketolase [bacterium]|nr:MAG: transketolase [bacterium]